jgi:hypothetical protein
MSFVSKAMKEEEFPRSLVITSSRQRKGILCPSFFDETAQCRREAQLEREGKHARFYVRGSVYVRGTNRSPGPDMERKVYSSVEDTGNTKTSTTSSCVFESYDSCDDSFVKSCTCVGQEQRPHTCADRVREHAAPLSSSRVFSDSGQTLGSDSVSPN